MIALQFHLLYIWSPGLRCLLHLKCLQKRDKYSGYKSNWSENNFCSNEHRHQGLCGVVHSNGLVVHFIQCLMSGNDKILLGKYENKLFKGKNELPGNNPNW